MKFNPLFIFFSTQTIYIYIYPPQPPFQSYFSPKYLQPIMGNSIVACLWKEAFMSLLIGAFWEFWYSAFEKISLSTNAALLSLLKESGKKMVCNRRLKHGRQKEEEKPLTTNRETGITIKKLHSLGCLPGTINRNHAENSSFSETFQHDWKICLIGPYSQWAAIWQNSGNAWNERRLWKITAETLTEIKSDILISGGPTVGGDNKTLIFKLC